MTINDDDNPQELWFIIILVVFALTSLAMVCICLQRYYVYRTISSPATQAPTEACTYFANGTYKKLRSLSKNEKTEISKAIKENQKNVVQKHIPPLLPEPVENARNALVFKSQRSRRHEDCFGFSIGNAGNGLKETARIPEAPMEEIRTDASGHYFGFASLRKRCIANYQSNSSAHETSKKPLATPKTPVSHAKMSFEYRREALEYALNVDRAIIRLGGSGERGVLDKGLVDKGLLRSANTDIAEHIKQLRKVMRPGNKPLYPALRTLKQDNIDAVSEVIRDAKYGAENFEGMHLERCKNLIDEICELISYSSGF